MFQIELHNALWLFVIVFMLHDFEEIITVENWSQKTNYLVKNTNNNLKLLIWKFWNINSHSFAKRDVFIFLATSSIVFLKVQFIDNNWTAVLFISFLCFVLFHNLVHIIQTIILKTYTPGLYSAVFLVTPYTVYLLNRLI
ncbi:HXXEE domain-containing protein [Lysinibacillus sp. NPDC093688]|uniref:HXXEE domain-containing protein n=1 Tax=Lysinibacillus sp. NPDC093688 TaxID=3390577 RepID=UPI003D01E78D